MQGRKSKGFREIFVHLLFFVWVGCVGTAWKINNGTSTDGGLEVVFSYWNSPFSGDIRSFSWVYFQDLVVETTGDEAFRSSSLVHGILRVQVATLRAPDWDDDFYTFLRGSNWKVTAALDGLSTCFMDFHNITCWNLTWNRSTTLLKTAPSCFIVKPLSVHLIQSSNSADSYVPIELESIPRKLLTMVVCELPCSGNKQQNNQAIREKKHNFTTAFKIKRDFYWPYHFQDFIQKRSFSSSFWRSKVLSPGHFPPKKTNPSLHGLRLPLEMKVMTITTWSSSSIARCVCKSQDLPLKAIVFSNP